MNQIRTEVNAVLSDLLELDERVGVYPLQISADYETGTITITVGGRE